MPLGLSLQFESDTKLTHLAQVADPNLDFLFLICYCQHNFLTVENVKYDTKRLRFGNRALMRRRTASSQNGFYSLNRFELL